MTTAEFNKLPKAEKRILIAKDVIKQVKASQLIALKGDYIDTGEIRMAFNLAENADIKKNYKKIRNCKVCAMGACLLTATKFGNSLVLKDLNDALWLGNAKADKLLKSIFSGKQLLMIETAFEGNNYGTRYSESVLDTKHLSREEDNKCVSFYDKHKHSINDDNSVLIAIMKNIIDNKGTFKP